MKRIVMASVMTTLLLGCGSDSSDSSSPKFASKALLGEALYSDVNLSKNRTQSCATCHVLEHGFADNRAFASVNPNQPFAASLGDDGQSLGGRNAPTAGYASFSPEFTSGTRDRVVSGFDNYEGHFGGQFWDGRESDLKGQAGGPPTNPIEMGMESKAAVVTRILENADYVASFESLYGSTIFDDAAAENPSAYEAMAESIAEFEKTSVFAPFDSKYDLSLKLMTTYPFAGEYEYAEGSLADKGKTLFFSSDLNCAACHQLKPLKDRQEVFTSFEYHNLGVPTNAELYNTRIAQGMDITDEPDLGLFDNVAEESAKGKFKVPTLRNVAVTAPYMHNGIFNELETVIKFYEHARFRATATGEELYPLNPESGVAWGEPEVSGNINHDELGRIGSNTPLNQENVDALVCFLMSLTDAKYENLLDSAKVGRCQL